MASPRIIKDLTDVEAALYRKKISDKYHTSVPKFLRSQGPFAVYDHAAHKGGRTYETIGAVNEQALTRFNEGNNDIQKRREAEKSQFYAVMDYMDREQAFRHVNKVKMNMANVDFIRTQIDDKARVKNAEKQVETLYYKPHFGPEETLDQVQKNLETSKQKQDFLRMNLAHQIHNNRELSEASRKVERAQDQKFIKH